MISTCYVKQFVLMSVVIVPNYCIHMKVRGLNNVCSKKVLPLCVTLTGHSTTFVHIVLKVNLKGACRRICCANVVIAILNLKFVEGRSLYHAIPSKNGLNIIICSLHFLQFHENYLVA